MKLKLKNYTHNKQLTIKQFIRLFLEELCYTHATFTEDGALWCGRNNWRSIRDITNITKYYYPQSDYFMVRDVLHSFGDELVGHYCYDVEDRICSLVSKHEHWDQYGIHNSNTSRYDSFHYPIEYFSSEDASKLLRKYNHSFYFSRKELLGEE